MGVVLEGLGAEQQQRVTVALQAIAANAVLPCCFIRITSAAKASQSCPQGAYWCICSAYNLMCACRPRGM